jgi:predicted ATPase
MADTTLETGATASDAFLIGRDRELDALRARLAVAGRGGGGLVVLAGEAGIGKTRLARAFAAAADLEGATVLWGGCYEGDWQPAYGPWVEALSGFLRSLAPEQRDRLFGPVAPVLAPLIPPLRTVFPRLTRPDALAPAEERLRLYDAVVQTLQAAATGRSVAVILDDLHWADRDSLELLRYVARGTTRDRLLTIGVYRDPEIGLDRQHPLTETLAALRREVDYDRIHLGGLTPDEVERYLTRATGQPLPQALVRAIFDVTAGNPFYTREVFRHLAEEGKIVRRTDRWSTDFSIAALGIPEGVRQVLGRRLARLGPSANAVLTVAAAFTGGVELRILAATIDAPEERVLDGIDQALQAGLLRPTETVPPAYDFAHAIVRHTIADGLNPDRRARLHRRIAETLERVYGDAADEHAAELAAQFHASAALPDAERGIPYALTAAEQARTGFAHERAAAFLRIARDLARTATTEKRAEILRRLALAEADALLLADAARSTIEAVTALETAAVEQETILDLLTDVARTLKDGGAGRSEWEPLVTRGLAFAGDRRDLRWARLQLLVDRMEFFRSGAIEAGRWLGHDPRAVAITRALGDEEDVARTFEPIGWRTRGETDAVLALARSGTRPTAVMRALDVAARDFNLRDGDLARTEATLTDLYGLRV